MTTLSRGSSDSTSASNDSRRTPSSDTTSAASTAATTTARWRCDQRTIEETSASTKGGSYVTFSDLPMNVLLLRPVPANERFGLGPFFRIEPLGMEYIAAALEARGHTVTLADLRFTRPLDAHLRASRPALVGIAAMHALETDEVVALVRRVRALAPEVPIIVGGHTAAAYPEPFLVAETTAVVLDDGEKTLPDVCDAIERRVPLAAVAGLALRGVDGEVMKTAG